MPRPNILRSKEEAHAEKAALKLKEHQSRQRKMFPGGFREHLDLALLRPICPTSSCVRPRLKLCSIRTS
jgi:hypothetical protein